GFAPRPLGDERQVEQPVIRTLTRLIGTISIPDLRREGRTAESGVHEALERVAGVLRSGGNVLLYPAGGLTRTGRERLGGNRGVYSLRGLVPDVRLVLVRTTGLWGSSFSWARGTAPDSLKLARACSNTAQRHILYAAPLVRISVSEPELPGRPMMRTLNEALETFYNADMAPALAVRIISCSVPHEEAPRP
ncbi:MAG: 2-acyl-glycerophospho-ethanolamine acyltransferase, partial [Bilophila wadsworthia]